MIAGKTNVFFNVLVMAGSVFAGALPAQTLAVHYPEYHLCRSDVA